MENASGPSSEEELVQLRNEGKITEAEYQQLLEALRRPSLSDLRRRPRVFRERFLWMSVAAIFIIATVLSLTVVVIRRSQNIDLIVPHAVVIPGDVGRTVRRNCHRGDLFLRKGRLSKPTLIPPLGNEDLHRKARKILIHFGGSRK